MEVPIPLLIPLKAQHATNYAHFLEVHCYIQVLIVLATELAHTVIAFDSRKNCVPVLCGLTTPSEHEKYNLNSYLLQLFGFSTFLAVSYFYYILLYLSIRRYIIDLQQIIHYLCWSFTKFIHTFYMYICYKVCLSNFLCTATRSSTRRI